MMASFNDRKFNPAILRLRSADCNAGYVKMARILGGVERIVWCEE
jgi:hypothetical protein